jgi:prevent-host-death family protein
VATGGYPSVMRSVGIKMLKNKLSEYVRIAAGGEVVLITDRDRVVAELVPPQTTRSESAPDALLADAIRKGYVTPARRPRLEAPDATGVAPLKQLLRDLAEDREDR